jgi:BirA family biotin operon repressor/biotin-[acetyl-CoA-carboxylase] ligase
MADAAEEVAGLPDRAIRLKWPNDLVIEASGPEAPLNGELTENGARARLEGPVEVRKLAGVLGESEGLGTDDPRVIVGIGVNADWPASDFPAELGSTMTSLHEASGGRPVDLAPLLAAFLTRLEVRVLALRAGRFDVADWIDRQVTTGHTITIDLPDGATETARALGVDVHSGGLVVAAASAPGERIIHSAEIRHVRLAVPESAISGRERV